MDLNISVGDLQLGVGLSEFWLGVLCGIAGWYLLRKLADLVLPGND
jgi:hypothetical protein